MTTTAMVPETAPVKGAGPSAPPATLAEHLHRIDLGISGALADADIQRYLAEYNWDVARLKKGQALYNVVLPLVQKQAAEYGDQVNATAQLDAAIKQANKIYMRLLKVARVSLKNDPGASRALGLIGDRKQTLAGWLKQARDFYDGALKSDVILAKLAEDGITQAKLTAGKALVDAVGAASVAQAKERGEAQDATQARDAAMEALDDWYSDFVAIARVALEDQPQLLEKLGIVAPS